MSQMTANNFLRMAQRQGFLTKKPLWANKLYFGTKVSHQGAAKAQMCLPILTVLPE